MDNVPLMQKIPRLFSISLDVGRTISQVGVWSNNSWLWKLRWIRDFFLWESSLVELLSRVLDNKRLSREGEGMINK